MKSSVEREVKLSVGPAFELPSIEGAVPRGTKTFRTVYYDTSDLRLARWGVHVRCRTGEAGSPRWTVKLPEGEAGPALARREVVLDAPDGVIPDEVSNLVRAYARTSLLAPVAVLETVRTKTTFDAAVEIDDDEVSVLEGGHVAARFREVEVELLDGGDESLRDDVVRRLRLAGAVDVAVRSKLAQALGKDALGAPEVEVPDLTNDPTVGEVATAAIANGVVRLLRHDPGVRLGGDPEDVHQARVSTRRLRSDLRTFGAVLDGEAVRVLREELKWLADALGATRDADVLLGRLGAAVGELPAADAKGGAALLRALEADRTNASEATRDAIDGERYLALVDHLVRVARQPPLVGDHDAPAARELRRITRREWLKLAKLVDRVGADPDDEALHEVRIRAKRTRYATEAAAPVLGKPAKRLAKSIAAVQEVLGDVHDAAVATDWLRAAADRVRGAGFAAGLLAGRERSIQDAARSQWSDAWRDARAAWKSFRS